MGPVGQILSVHLKEAGCDVSVCDVDKEKMNLIRKEGVHLQGKFKKHTFFNSIFTNVRDLAAYKFDLLIFSVKVYHTPSAAAEAEKLNWKNIRVMSAQNGIDVEENLSNVFGESNTFRMVVNFAGNLNAPNVVNVTFFNAPNYVASVDDSQSEFAKKISGMLNKVSLDTVAIDSFNLLNKVWEKTILNSSLSALCGISRLTMREAMDLPDMVDIIEQTIEEAVKVAEAEDIHFGANFIKLCLRYLKKGGNHFPSLAVDMLNNRQTEIDFFNGKIIEYGKKHYVRTPLNLVFTNLVKAYTDKNSISPKQNLDVSTLLSIVGNGKKQKEKSEGKHFLGIDLGSYYTKITVIDKNEKVVHQELLKTLNRDKKALYNTLQDIQSDFDIESICATGYGREHFPNSDTTKTEVTCAAFGLSRLHNGRKNIIDIGAEDIKIIRASKEGKVEEFYMNNKCAAGTGAFITEVAERAEIDLKEMSLLASKSKEGKELNSFCTVFAKTEIMSWIFDEMKPEDIAKGIYLSIASKIFKIKMEQDLPNLFIGGVISHHPYFKNIIAEKFGQEVIVPEFPQFVVSYGAALFAKEKKVKNELQENLKMKV